MSQYVPKCVKEYTDNPRIRIHLGVSSTFRTPEYLEYRSTGGLRTASTGSISSTEPQVQPISAVRTSELLGVRTRTQTIKSIEPLTTASTCKYILPKYCRLLSSTPVAPPPESSLLQLPTCATIREC